MTNDNSTHITMVIDRSGSMYTIRTDAGGGINSLITTNKALGGDCSLLLVDFCAPTQLVDPTWYKVHHNGPINDFDSYKMDTGGGTSLLDAIGRAITDTGRYLKGLPEGKRPAKVLFMVMTDGQENSSREYSYEKIADMIKHQEEVYNWEFSFLGAGLDVAKQGTKMGFGVSNITNFAPNSGAATRSAFSSTSDSFAAYRTTGTATYAGKVEADGTVVEDAGRVEVTK